MVVLQEHKAKEIILEDTDTDDEIDSLNKYLKGDMNDDRAIVVNSSNVDEYTKS